MENKIKHIFPINDEFPNLDKELTKEMFDAFRIPKEYFGKKEIKIHGVSGMSITSFSTPILKRFSQFMSI